MPPPTVSFPAFVSTQLEELRQRLVAEFERLHEHQLQDDAERLKDGGGTLAIEKAMSVPMGPGTKGAKDAGGTVGADKAMSVPTGSRSKGAKDGGGTVGFDKVMNLPVDPNDKLPAAKDGTNGTIEAHALVHEEQQPDLSEGKEPDLSEGNVAFLQQTRSPLKQVQQEEGSDGGCWMSEGSPPQIPATPHSRLSPPPDDCESPRRMRLSTLSHRASDSAGELSQMSTFAENGVIYPASMAYRSWMNFVSVLVLFSCFLTPFRFSFFDGFGPMDNVDTALDIVLGIDILLTFNVAVLTKHGLVTLRSEIFLAYALSSRLSIDLAATVPFDTIWMLFADASNPTNQDVASALGLLRLLRVNRLLILFRELQKSTYFNLLGVVVAKFVVCILLCTHTSGCIFYKLAQYSDFGENTWVSNLAKNLRQESMPTRYIHVLFWAVGTFKAGPASGALIPTSNPEMLLACCTMMINICLQTYLVSNMAALLTTADMRIYSMRNQLVQVRDFSARYKLPRELQHQLAKFVKFKLSNHDEADQTLLSGLPDLYRQQVSHVLFEDLVRGVEIFRSCAAVFLRQLHSSFKATLYMPAQQLATIDGPSSSLQIVAEGEVELRHRTGSVIDVLRAGECFTAVSFLCRVGQPYSVRTRMLCRVLSLGSSAWEAACAAFPENLQHVKHNLLVHCEDKVAEFVPTSTGFEVYNELMEVVRSHLVEQEELTVAMFCSSAARGDLRDVKRRLVLNSPNCSDYDHRTPLHVAAAQGQKEVCVVLIEAQAHVDSVDNFGRTPLLEACRARKESVADLLHARGASLGRGKWIQVTRAGSDSAVAKSAEAGELCEAASDVDQLWYLRALLRYGADPNLGDYDARRALHVASASGNTAAVELLISHPRINLNPVDNFGRTPLMDAVRHGHEPCARLMQGRGAFHGFVTDLKQDTSSNAIPAGQELCRAAFSNQAFYLHNLVKYCGIDVDVADYDLRTALMLASAEGNMSVAMSLVQNKADVHRRDRWGHTAITEAEEHGHGELANVLRVVGARGFEL